MPRPNDIALIDGLEIRSTATQNSGAAPFGEKGFSNGIVSVENGLDQNVTVQVQGKATNADTWQSVGSSITVTASGTGYTIVTEPWPELRAQVTAAGTPTTGDIDVYLSRVKSGAGSVASTGGVATSVDVIDRMAREVGVVGVEEYATVATGELQGSASALQMPSVACSLVKFKARSDNAGHVYIGGSGVTAPDGTTDTTTGFELEAGQETGWLPCSNLNIFYRICDNSGDDLTYIALT